MKNLKMIDTTAGEVIHLFNVINKYGATCGLEFNTEHSIDPLLGLSASAVESEYFEGDDGDSVIIKMDKAEFAFELKNHSFGSLVIDSQIHISAMENEGKYIAWFLSGPLNSKGIEEANTYDVEFDDKKIHLNPLSDDFEENLNWLKGLLEEGRVIKKTVVIGDGNQVLNVGFYVPEQSNES